MAVDEVILTDRLKSCTWTPAFRQNDMTTRGGASQSVENGPPFWVASFRYENLGDAQYRALTSWVNRRNGSHIPFLAFLPSRKFPANYPAETNAGLTLSAHNPATGAITLNRANMAPGDHIGWLHNSGARFVGEIAEIISSTGSASTFTTFPPAPAPDGLPFPRTMQAYGRFRLVPGSYRPDDRHDGFHSIAFEARQEEGAI